MRITPFCAYCRLVNKFFKILIFSLEYLAEPFLICLAYYSANGHQPHTTPFPCLLYSYIISVGCPLYYIPGERSEWRGRVHVNGPVSAAGGLGGHDAEAGGLERLEELEEAARHTPHNVAAVVVLRQQERQLQHKVLLQTHLNKNFLFAKIIKLNRRKTRHFCKLYFLCLQEL